MIWVALAPVLLLTSCVGAAGPLVPMLFALAALVAVGCASSHGVGDDAGPGSDAPVTPDAGGGSYSTCCTDFGSDGYGVVGTCFCPAMTACNYGLGLVICPDGRCTYGPDDSCSADAGPPDVDAGVPEPDAGAPQPDAGAGAPEGTWEACCEFGDGPIGTVSTCFCPAGVECNYGWFVPCGESGCVLSPDACPAG